MFNNLKYSVCKVLIQRGLREALIDRDFSEFNFSGLDFMDADFRNTDFKNTDFRNTDFRNTNFWNADFMDADFRNTDFMDADFRNTDFRNTDFRNTDFRNTNFWNVIGDGLKIKTLTLPKYKVVIIGDKIQIGCKKYTFNEWFNFTDEHISKMDEGALWWWNKWKEVIKLTYNNIKD